MAKILNNLEVTGTVTTGTIANATVDTNVFLVSDNGLVKYRTGTQLRSDIGAGTGSGSVTSVTVTGSNGLSGTGTVTSSGTITLSNSDRGSSQAIYKNVVADSGGTATANSNNDSITIAGGSNVSTVRSGDTITINATDTTTNNYVSSVSFNTTNGILTLNRSGLTALTVDLDGRYVTSSGVTSIATTNGITGGTITSTGTIQLDGTVVRTSGTQTIGGLKTFSNDVELANTADLKFVDLAGTFPTSGKGFDWTLNNDGARIYAIQPASDSIDLTFEIRDNASANDRFVFHVNDYRGAAFDKYPLVIRGGTQFDLVDSALYTDGTLRLSNAGALTVTSGNFTGDVTVGGGDIILNGTGRIQGVDTVSANTDAANKLYVDNAVAGVPVGDITAVVAGTNLSGGGTSGSVTLNMATGGVGSGAYGSTSNGTKIDTITIDAYGRVTAVATGATGSSNLAIGTTASTAKAGNTTTITTAQANAITANTAKVTDTGTPAILSNGTVPSLNTGISAAEVRSLIGAGTSSSTGTVTAVSSTIQGSAMNIGGSPITSSGTLAFGFAGGAGEYIDGAGDLQAFPSIPQGDITGVTAGTGMTGGGTSGTVTLNVIGSTGITANANNIAIDATVATLVGVQTFTNKSGNISMWTNDSGYTTNVGDITGVTAGSGISGGGTSGTVTVTNSDRGSSQSIFKNIAVSGQSTVVADNNNDTLTLVAAGGMTITTNATNDTITFNPNDDNSNFYLNGITKSGNTLTFSVLGTTNQTYTFGSNAYNSTTIPTNNNQITNGAGYTTNTGTTTASNTQTFTNKSGNISQWTNDSGYVTSSGGSMSSWILKEGNGVESTSVTNGETVTFAQGNGITSEMTSTTSGGTITITNTKPNIVQTTITGNAGSATVLQTARTIAGVSFNGSANISLNNNAITNGAGYITSYVNTTYTAGAGLALTGTVFSNTITNNNQLTNGAGYITSSSVPTVNNATVTVTTGTGLDGATSFTLNQSANKTIALSLDLNELGAGGTLLGTDSLVAVNGTVSNKQLISSIPLSIFSNNSGWTSNVGDITGVTAGTNLTGGGNTGTVTLNMATGGVGAGTYGSTSNSTKVDTITVDAYGRVTAVATGATGSGNMTSWIIKEGNGTESTSVTNGETLTIAQGTGIQSEMTSTTSGGTITITNTSPDTGVPALLSNGTTPTLNTGISAAEVRSLIGAGTSSTSGTVTSAGLVVTNGNSIGISNTPITTSGDLEISFIGNAGEYINGNGDLIAFPGIPQGDITAVVAGTGISGGGTSGSVTITNAAPNVSTNLSTSVGSTTLRVNSSDGTDATLPAATTTVAGVMTGVDKAKLDGIATGATNVTNNNQLTNGAGYTTNTGTTTASNTQTFTNKGGNISQWTNNSGYITSSSIPSVGNGTLTVTGGTGLSGSGTFTANQSGNTTITLNNSITNNNQLTNGAGYTTFTANQALNTSSNPTFNDLYIADQIFHLGDTNTYMQFHAADQWRVVTGAVERLEVNNSNTTVTTTFSVNNTGDRVFQADPGQGTFFLGDIDQLTDGCYITNGANASGLDTYINGTHLSRFDQSGTLTVQGNIIAFGSPSDIRLKENIKPIESALDKAMKLQGVTFDWKENDSILDIKEDIGFIAQDVQKVVPELVRENENGMLSMRHQGITPILLEAIKELKAEIEELKKKIK